MSVELLCWIDHVWSSKECEYCICDLYLSVFLYRVCLCFYMLKVIFSVKGLRARSQVFALLMVFLCVILHTMWSGKSLQLLYILPFSMWCLSDISIMFVKIM